MNPTLLIEEIYKCQRLCGYYFKRGIKLFSTCRSSLYIENREVNIKVVSVHNIKTWDGGIAPLIPSCGTGWRLVVSFTPQSLNLPGNCPRCALNRR
jgi:nitrogen fixation protein